MLSGKPSPVRSGVEKLRNDAVHNGAAGEEVLVTERGVPIARIVPAARVGHDEQRWRDLERQGLMRLGSGTLPRDFWRLPRGRDASARVRSAVTNERGHSPH